MTNRDLRFEELEGLQTVEDLSQVANRIVTITKVLYVLSHCIYKGVYPDLNEGWMMAYQFPNGYRAVVCFVNDVTDGIELHAYLGDGLGPRDSWFGLGSGGEAYPLLVEIMERKVA
jgi:hypothetical protein